MRTLSFFEELDQKAIQFKLMRFLFGGIFVKLSHTWYTAEVNTFLPDNRRLLKVMLHHGDEVMPEDDASITGLEEYTAF